jgi:hypothetical protein
MNGRSYKTPFVIFGSLVLAGIGVWEILSSYVIGYTDWTFGHWNDVVCGAIVVVLGIVSAVVGRSVQGFWAIVRRAAPAMAIAGIGLYLAVMDFARYYQHIGRVDTFFNHLVAAALILVGFTVAATILALEERPMTPEGEEVLRQAHLAAVR